MKKFVAAFVTIIYVFCVLSGCSYSDKTDRNYDNDVHDSNNFKIETEYFYMTVPEHWNDLYSYSFREISDYGDITLNVCMKSENEFSEAHVFSVYILSLEDEENIQIALEGWINPIAVLSYSGEDKYLLGYSLASEMSCTESEESKFMQMIEDVPQIINSVKPKADYGIEMWNAEIEEKINGTFATCVPVTFSVLDSTFAGYRNQTGATFFELTNEGSLASHYLKSTDNVTYYFGTDNAVVGVENDKIILHTCWASDIVGYTSPSVRDVINALEAPELFEIQPELTEVNNSYNTANFYYWKINNGYIGFIAIGGNDPAKCYGYAATSVVLFKDIKVISTIAD